MIILRICQIKQSRGRQEFVCWGRIPKELMLEPGSLPLGLAAWSWGALLGQAQFPTLVIRRLTEGI